jgi:hypothetical protein
MGSKAPEESLKRNFRDKSGRDSSSRDEGMKPSFYNTSEEIEFSSRGKSLNLII